LSFEIRRFRNGQPDRDDDCIMFVAMTCSVSSITDKTFIGLDYIRVTRRMSYKKQERLTLREDMGSPPVIGGVSVPRLFIILC
jgi:hypothetical protein